MKLIVGNWKMYPKSLSEARAIVGSLKGLGKRSRGVRVVICPPVLYLAPLLSSVRTTQLTFGAQNASVAEEGAYTGEISPRALRSLGATHVILGHSERRALGESDAFVAQKAIVGAKSGLTVVLCVGEAKRDEAGAYFSHVAHELRASLVGFPKSLTRRLVIAYEPIWAIGVKAKRSARPEDFREMSVFIRRNLVDRFGKNDGFAVPILYGGSVDEKNAEGFLVEGAADGLLVGRASLDPKKFAAIITAATPR